MTTTLPSAPQRVRRWIQSGIATLLITAVVGCGGDSSSSTGPGNADPTGLYSLRTVGKDAIPAQIYRGPLPPVPGEITIGITGGELILDDEGAFSMALDLKMSGMGGTLPRPVKIYGDYEIDGGQLTMFDGVGNEFEGTLRNGVVTVGLDLVGLGTVKQYAFRFVP